MRDTVRSAIGAAIQQIHTFPVERTALRRLHVKLDRIHQDNVNTAVPSYLVELQSHDSAVDEGVCDVRFEALRSAPGGASTRRDDDDRTSSIDWGQVLEGGPSEVAQCLVAS